MSSRPLRAPLWELVIARMKADLREPSTLFWTFAFPLLTTLALGLAFRSAPLPPLQVAVVEGPAAAELQRTLQGEPDLVVRAMPQEQAQDALRRGKVAVIIVPGAPPELIVDPMQADGRTARAMVLRALEHSRGGPRMDAKDTRVSAPGSRYVDFLIPGLLGLNLMMGAVWGLGWSLVQMRTGKLLKRLVASPMRRAEFLLSFGLYRLISALVEILFFILYARLLFEVRITGSTLGFILFALFGTFCFAGLALLSASRAQNTQTANGVMNLITMPMMILSGVFFSAENFPGWLQPILQALPLTALLDGLRGIALDGTPLTGLWDEVLILGAWGLVTFGLALKVFRWR